jgi:hypothetical protein
MQKLPCIFVTYIKQTTGAIINFTIAIAANVLKVFSIY